MMRMGTVGAVCAAAILGLGCTSQIGHMTMMSAENLNGVPAPVARHVEGRHCQVQWTLDAQPSMQRAMRQAIGQAGSGNALTNVSVYLQRQFWLLVQRNCLIVEGDVVQVDGLEGA